MVKEIKFKNYKIFRNWQTLKLRPITILIGKNNSGKSAVAELLAMIANSLNGKPLNWITKVGDDSTNIIELGSSFVDLVYNRNAIQSLELVIANDKDNDNETLELNISKVGLLQYKYNGKEVDVDQTTFKGFLVDGKKFKDLDLKLDYIGAIRVEPKSSYPLNNNGFDKIGITGKNAYNVLIQDAENTGQIVKEVSDWYKENFENWSVEILEIDAKTETQYQVTISNNNIDAINLANTGQGIHQVLPLIVLSFMPTKEQTLLVIEEPETHLHPAAHSNLAQRFADSYIEDQNKRYLIETHSQNFVLRLRGLVAAGVLDKKDLAIHYVDFDEEINESSITLIEVDEDGEVEWWPTGIFNESLEEVIKIRKAQEAK